MCICGGHMCICIPNIKFLCLTLWQGEVCTDDEANADNANDDGQSMIVKALWLINQMSQKGKEALYKSICNMKSLGLWAEYYIEKSTKMAAI